MLIRLVQHFVDNPNHIDKLIAIKGLPEEWIFRPSKHGGKELIRPWEPDVDANIPKHIRNLCEVTEITEVFPPIHSGQPSVVDHRTILGIRLNFMTQPGQDMWEKISRYLDKVTPRDMKVPVPCLVAPNHRSQFDPHMVRRGVRGSLEMYACEIPEVDLTKFLVQPEYKQEVKAEMETPKVEAFKEEMKQEVQVFKCDQCPKEFNSSRAIRMHKMSGHKKEKVGV